MKGITVISVAPALVAAKPQLDAMKHDARTMSAKQFNGAIGKFRDGHVHTLWFYGDTSEDDAYLETYNKLAKTYKGIIAMHSIDCTVPANEKFCKDNGAESTPAVQIYPPQSFMQPYMYKNFNDEKKFKTKLAKMIPGDNVKMLTPENIDEFIAADISKPKVILFSKQDKPAWVYNALSSEGVFKRSLRFGFTKDESLLQKFKKVVGKKPKLPTLALFTNHGKDGEKFKGEFNFQEMHEWANRHSESGMGDKVHSKGGEGDEAPSVSESKPWLVADVPEMHQASHRDICLKNEGLCCIYVSDGPPDAKAMEMLKGLKDQERPLMADRGTVLKWMWLDAAVEGNFKELFNVKSPGFVVFNPHKRLRFTKADDAEDEPTDEEKINALIDKILGGDARFKVVKGQKLPEWAKRAKEEDKKKDDKKTEL